jgi:hypothetical protein
MSRANGMEEMDQALPLLTHFWENPTPWDKEKVSSLIFPTLEKMEKAAKGQLDPWVANALDRNGLEGVATTIWERIIKGPGEGGLGNFNPEMGKLSNWVFTMMKNRFLDLARKLKETQGGSSLGDCQDGDDVALGHHDYSKWASQKRNVWKIQERDQEASQEKDKEMLEFRHALFQRLLQHVQDCGLGDPLGHMVSHFLETGEVLTLKEQARMLHMSTTSLHRLRKKLASQLLHEVLEEGHAFLAA